MRESDTSSVSSDDYLRSELDRLHKERDLLLPEMSERPLKREPLQQVVKRLQQIHQEITVIEAYRKARSEIGSARATELASPNQERDPLEEHTRQLAGSLGWRLMHRRKGRYWVMADQPMTLVEVRSWLHKQQKAPHRLGSDRLQS